MLALKKTRRGPPKRRAADAVLARLITGLALASGMAQAETAKLTTGEYAPFVTQQQPEDGVTAAIVSAAFKTQGITVIRDFLPWKRGYADAERGKYVGTFPYLKTDERESAFLYSDPIYADHFRLFVRKEDDKVRTWAHKSLCIPLGYDTTQIQKFTTENSIILEQPPEISNCFNMLDRGRVDAVWVSQLVGMDTAKSLFGSNSRIYPLDTSLVGGTHYYFIVSRQLPEAQKWLLRFNTGLKVIKKDGTYQQIVNRFGASQ